MVQLLPDDRLFVLTGAGVSAESGLATFRGSGGLWNGHRLDQVATPEAWAADPLLVWRFYSMRRRDAAAAAPNAGHLALVRLEEQMGSRFYLCTQNVDDLHERAGSHRVHHMHGSLFQSRCVRCEEPFYDDGGYELVDDLPLCAICGAAVRPHIVWFGEVPLDWSISMQSWIVRRCCLWRGLRDRCIQRRALSKSRTSEEFVRSMPVQRSR